jgi:hypothetical protein
MRKRALRCFFVACMAPVLFGAGFETGAVKRSDGGRYYNNAIPSIARLEGGELLAVWTFSGKDDKKLRIAGALSSDGGRSWAEPRILIDTPGKNDADPILLVDGRRLLVYSATVGMPDRLDRSQVFMTSSGDDGRTWASPVEIALPRKYTASMVSNAIKLMDGTLVLPFAWDLWAEKGTLPKTEGEMDLVSGVLRSTDGVHWTPFGELHISDPKVTPYSTGGLCEPALVELRTGELFMLMRTGTSFLYESRSRDGGLTWDAPRRSLLMGHNTPAALWRVEEHPDEIIVIWNNSPLHRYPLSAAISSDGGRHWTKPRDVAVSDGPQVSYPDITQTKDGMFLAVWQQQLKGGGRDIRWARFTRDWIEEQ